MVYGRSKAKQRHLCQDVPLGPVLWERISCQSVKTSVLADGDLWEVVVCAGHRRSRWLWASLKHSIPKQIHKYSGCGKDCRSMNIPFRADVGVRGPILLFYSTCLFLPCWTWNLMAQSVGLCHVSDKERRLNFTTTSSEQESEEGTVRETTFNTAMAFEELTFAL